MQASHITLGKAGEDYAAQWLGANGYTVMERNWRHGHLEIDIICRHEAELVFVEVKTRRDAGHGGGPGAITRFKRQRLEKAAAFWLSSHDYWLIPCRFDVVCLYQCMNGFRLEHYRNAFIPTLDSSNPNWQPW